MNTNICRIIISAIALGCLWSDVQTTAAQESQQVLQQLDELLQKATAFEMGGDANPFQDIERIVFTLPTDSGLREAIEAKLIAALAADGTTLDAKRVLCTQLRVIGTSQSVPALEGLLTDAELSHMARYALERLDVAEASAALVRALGKTDGKLQAGVLDSLGNRRCAEAVDPITGLLQSQDEPVAQAAATALGRIGNAAAVKALQDSLAVVTAEQRVATINALCNAAERALDAQQADLAAGIYQQLQDIADNQAVQYAALRGLLSVEGSNGLDRLVKTMQDDQPRKRRFAISLIPLVPGEQATKRLAGILPDLEPADQVMLLLALGQRGDVTATEVIVAAVVSHDAAVRLAALEALGNMADPAAVAPLLAAAAASTGEEQKVARAALRTLPGEGVDARLIQAVKEGDAKLRSEVISVLAARNVTTAVPSLLEAATDADATVRLAALNGLGSLADASQIDALTGLLLSADAADVSAALDMVDRICQRIEQNSEFAKALNQAMADANASQWPRLLRLLGKTRATEALRTIRGSLSDGKPDVRDAAVEALAQWHDPVVGDDLLELLAAGTHDQYRDTILAGYLRLALSAVDPAAMFTRAIEYVEKPADKKAVLEGLGLSGKDVATLEITLRYLDDPALRNAAAIAAIRIAYQLRNRDEKRAKAALQTVLAKIDHPDVEQRAQEVINELSRFDDHILQWVTVGPFQQEGKMGADIYALKFPPEEDPDAVQWKPVTKGIGSWEINLEATYGGLDHVAAYLRTQVWSDSDQAVQLEMGSDDGIKAWLNGQLLYDQWNEGGASPRDKRVKAELKQGWNDLMLKVVDQAGGWVGACRIRKPDGTKLEGLKIKAQ